MKPLDGAFRQDFLDMERGEQQYRSLVMEAFGVQPEAREYIKANSTVAWESPERVRGWYWDKQTVIPKPPQAEGTLHELAHVAYERRMAEHPDETYTLAYQTAVYGVLPRHLALILGTTSETMDFLRGYYEGIGDWPGMYQHDRSKPKVRVMDFMRGKADIANVITWEIFAGCCSFTMGQINDGPRRLPNTMRWLFQWFFTGNIEATPYYQSGGVP